MAVATQAWWLWAGGGVGGSGPTSSSVAKVLQNSVPMVLVVKPFHRLKSLASEASPVPNHEYGCMYLEIEPMTRKRCAVCHTYNIIPNILIPF